ncbi:MAG: hypothetical protein WBE76_31595 [Terracidiphilus sp.]
MRPPDAAKLPAQQSWVHLSGKTMRNITVIVEDEVYTRARVWAAEHNTSVSAVVQYMLSTLPTDWRTRNFLYLLARHPEVRKPIAPFRTPEPPAPSPTSEAGPEPSFPETSEPGTATSEPSIAANAPLPPSPASPAGEAEKAAQLFPGEPVPL